MIHTGRHPKPAPSPEKSRDTRLMARLTAILGTVVFTVFLCTSVNDTAEVEDVGSFGEGAYAVFAPVDGTADQGEPEDVIAVEDGSVWAYLESIIARLIYGGE